MYQCEAFFGAGEFYHHEHVTEGYFTALGNLIDSDQRFRRTVPREVMMGGADRAWEEEARGMMHAVVDEMFDGTTFARRTQKVIRGGMLQHLERVTKVAQSRNRQSRNRDASGGGGSNNKRRRGSKNMAQSREEL